MNSQDQQITAQHQPQAQEADFVATYLEEHPEFFRQHPQVLERLHLPHSSGAAISLVEKQLAVLRERNTELRSRLNNLMETSKANDNLFNKSRILVLDLIKADSAEKIFTVLHEHLTVSFNIEYYSLVLLDRNLAAPGLRCIPASAVGEALPVISTARQPLCGVFRPAEIALLFGENAATVGSATAVALTAGSFYGILALGSSDQHHYHGGMDTLFLEFIADAVNVVLPPRLP